MFGLLHALWDALEAQLEQQSHIPSHNRDPHAGMHPALYALVFGIVSGLSLPIGSWLGVTLSPVSDKACGMMMAFGAGALLFAVTVELYGHALRDVAAGKSGMLEMFTTIFGALIGAALYLAINQWLEEYLTRRDEETPPARSAVSSAASESDSLLQSLQAQQAKEQEEKLIRGEIPSNECSPATQERRRTLAETTKDLISAFTSTLTGQNAMNRIRGREKAMRVLTTEKEVYTAQEDHARSIAFALFLGLLVDGVPEGILMGFLSAEGHLTPVLIISLFIANFPEAFSSASLLVQTRMSTAKIVGMWLGLCLLVGSLAGLSCYMLLSFYPAIGHHGFHSSLPISALVFIALVEGITGGAMIACISEVMLPEAFERVGKKGNFYAQSGFLCTSGFLLSVALKALYG